MVAGVSKFLNTLKTEQDSKWERTLLDELLLQDDEHGVITVPAGFRTDFASIRFLHNILLFVLYALLAGYGNYAATVHDWLYTTGPLTRKQADAVLYRGLRAEGIARWRAWLFWAGVRIGGGKRYKINPA